MEDIKIPKRTCSECGKEKEVQGGKTCENGHFICKDCVYTGISFMRFGSVLTTFHFVKSR